jgi:hypothetical protein
MWDFAIDQITQSIFTSERIEAAGTAGVVHCENDNAIETPQQTESKRRNPNDQYQPVAGEEFPMSQTETGRTMIGIGVNLEAEPLPHRPACEPAPRGSELSQ